VSPSDYGLEIAALLDEQLRAVIRTHTPEIEPVLAGAAIPAGASPDLLARTIQAQGMWFQLLSIA